MTSDYSYWRHTTPKCPHCGKLDEMDDPLSDLFEDEAIVHLDCQFCGKDFVVCVSAKFEYSSAVDEDAASDDIWGPRVAAET